MAPERKSNVRQICEVLDRLAPDWTQHQGTPKDPTWFEGEAHTLLRRIVDYPLTPQYVRDVWLVSFAVQETFVRRGAFHKDRIERHVGDMPLHHPAFKQIADTLNELFTH